MHPNARPPCVRFTVLLAREGSPQRSPARGACPAIEGVIVSTARAQKMHELPLNLHSRTVG